MKISPLNDSHTSPLPVVDRLEPSGQIDQAQAHMGQAHALVAIKPEAVGAAVAEHGRHGAQLVEARGLPAPGRQDTRDAAHG